MAFSSGNASTLDDFCVQLFAFAVANAGFSAVADVNILRNSVSVPLRAISKNGIYFSAFQDDTGMGSPNSSKGLFSYMAYSATPNGADFGTSLFVNANSIVADAMPGVTMLGRYDLTGPYPNHWFYTDGNTVHAVIEFTTGVFGHMSFGTVTKYGTWVGGEYLSASCPRTGTTWLLTAPSDYYSSPFPGSKTANGAPVESYVRIASSASSSDFVPLADTIAASTQQGGFSVSSYYGLNDRPGSMFSRLLQALDVTTTWRTLFTPMLLRLNDGTDHQFIAGIAENVVWTKMTQTMNAGDIIETDWQIFPLVQRAYSTTLYPYSNDWAIAYKRVT